MILLNAAVSGLFSRAIQWWVDIYFPPWCRAGPYFVGVLLGFALFRVNGRLKIHPVSTSLHYWPLYQGAILLHLFHLALKFKENRRSHRRSPNMLYRYPLRIYLTTLFCWQKVKGRKGQLCVMNDEGVAVWSSN